MFRRAKFLEVLLEIRQEMARDADYDADLFAELVRSGKMDEHLHTHSLPDKEIKKSPRPRSRRK